MRSTSVTVAAAVFAGLCLASIGRLTAQGDSSLNSTDIEYAEAKTALEAVIKENQELRGKLDAAGETITALQTNLATSSAEGEIFRRQAAELKLRLEALGIQGAGSSTSKVEQRLLKAMSDLKVVDDERKALSDALIQLSEAVIRYQKAAVSTDADARLALETEMRGAMKALGVSPPASVEGAPVASTLTDGMVISIRDELALVVANLGHRHGVKVGMPFQVIRDERIIGTVRVVDVREKISGAVIQDSASEKQQFKVGDRLRVDAQQ
jgi:hypothetical protein